MFNRKVTAGIALVSSVAMLAGLSACGRTENSASESKNAVTSVDDSPATGELNIWAMGNEGDLLGDFAKDFEKENPDVKVNVTAIPWSSAHDKIQTAIAAGNVPDLAQMGTTWMADFSNAFSEVPSNFDVSDFSEGPLGAGQVGGKQVGVPWYIDTRVLYYRTDIAEQAGWDHAPTTWDEFRQMAQDMQKVDGVNWGAYLATSGTDAFIGDLPFAYSAGAKLSDDEETKWTIDTEPMRKALTFTSNMFKDGIANPAADVSPGANIANFVSGDTPMFLEGPTAASQIEELGGDGFGEKYATVVLPKMDKDAEPATSFIGGCDLVVFKEAKNAQAAWKFIQWASKPEVQAKWYKVSSDLPASQKAWTLPELTSSDKLKAFGEQLKNTRAVPAVTTWAQVGAEGDRLIEQLNKGQVSVEEGLKNLQAVADSIGMGK